MIISKSQLIPLHPTLLDEEESFDPSYFSDSYPVKDILSCHLSGEISKEKDYIACSFHIVAKAVLLDSYTNDPFEHEIQVDDDFDILEEEDDIGEGYIVPGNEIDLSALCLKLIRSSLPIKVLKPGSKLPKSGKGYSVYSEEEAKKQAKESYNPAFDALKDYEFDDKDKK